MAFKLTDLKPTIGQLCKIRSASGVEYAYPFAYWNGEHFVGIYGTVEEASTGSSTYIATSLNHDDNLWEDA